MGGICGKLGFDHLTFQPSFIEDFFRHFPGSGHFPIHQTSLGSAIIGAQASSGYISGISQKTHYNHTFLLGFYGTIYNPQATLPGEKPNQNIIDRLLNALEQNGMPFLNRLKGDFVLTFWDGREQSLFLAVDHTRIHPLYYQASSTGLAFSSFLPALLKQSLDTSYPINPQAVMAMVSLSVIPTPETIFQNIAKLPPAHFLAYKNGKAIVAPYWNMEFSPSHSASSRTLQHETRELFSLAISSRLQTSSQANHIGAFLSGGIDSSTIVGTMAQQLSPIPVKSFSMGFDVEGFNELTYARITAKAYQAEHFEYYVTSDDVFTALPYLIKNYDEPFGNASAIPTYFCAKLAKEHGVDVLFAGDGGDELFAGNDRYATQRIFDYYFLLPKFARKTFLEGLFCSSAKNIQFNLFQKIIKYIRRANIPYPDRLLSWGVKDYTDKHEFWNPLFIEKVGETFSILDYFRSHYEEARTTSELNRQLYIDIKTTLSDNDIPKVVSMTKAANIAVRFPFLDPSLMEFAAKIPANLKMKRLQLRSFFKDTYRDFLPPEVLKKTKHGFGLPITFWLRENKNLHDLMNDVLGSQRFQQRGLITPKGLKNVLENHKTDNTSLYGTIIWNLLILEMWLELHDQ